MYYMGLMQIFCDFFPISAKFLRDRSILIFLPPTLLFCIKLQIHRIHIINFIVIHSLYIWDKCIHFLIFFFYFGTTFLHDIFTFPSLASILSLSDVLAPESVKKKSASTWCCVRWCAHARVDGREV